MLSFQVGTALSVPLLLAVGPSSTTWLRLVGAAAILWAVTKPSLVAYSGRMLAAAGLLGAATCGMAIFYAEAIARIPLGMATAIEFAGPLAVAVVASRGLLDIAWAGLAGMGVALLTLSAAGWSADTFGIACAFAAAACWAAYIVLTKQVGQAFKGLQGLTVSLTVAALVATPFGIGQLRSNAHAWEIAASLALGILIPVLPYGLEMLALRRMSTRAFGILMSADPAISSLVGLLILHQTLGAQKAAGIACVVFASLGTMLGRPFTIGPLSTPS
jgi:inner membrane transporter RhtA